MVTSRLVVIHPPEQVYIPAPKKPQTGDNGEGLVPIADLEPWARLAFKGTKRLNPMQSKVWNSSCS